MRLAGPLETSTLPWVVLFHVEPLDLVVQHHSPLMWLGVAFGAITAITFLAIGGRLLIALRGGHYNALSLVTGLIFVTCGGGHLIHVLHATVWSAPVLAAARLHWSDWHLLVADGLTAAAGVFYWLQRGRFKGMVAGAAMYEDLEARRVEALRLNDDVVQELHGAVLALKDGEAVDASRMLRRAKEALDD